VNAVHQEKYDPSLLPVEGVVHLLHNVVGHVLQPFDGSFVANCEIYNWKELNAQHDLHARNDAELMYFLMKKKGLSALSELDGDFAFIWKQANNLIFGRDRMGVKPLLYDLDDSGIIVASEGKVLDEPVWCEPGCIYAYTNKQLIATAKSDLVARTGTYEDVKKAVLVAIKKRVEDVDKIAILFSGGVDSTLLASICKTLGKKVTLYTAAFEDGNLEEARDVEFAKMGADALQLPLEIIHADFKETEEAIKMLIPLIESDDIVKVGVALPFYFCSRKAHADGHKVILSGLGAEECFAGYDRHLKVLEAGGDVNLECKKGFDEIWKRDLYRDDVITMHFSLELRLPFLDKELIPLSLGVPVEQKINAEQKKIILRKIASECDVPAKICSRKKLGAQYGSKFDRAIEKLAGKKGMKKQDYLRSL